MRKERQKIISFTSIRDGGGGGEGDVHGIYTASGDRLPWENNKKAARASGKLLSLDFHRPSPLLWLLLFMYYILYIEYN